MSSFFKRILSPQDQEPVRGDLNNKATTAASLIQCNDVDEKSASPIAVIYQSEFDYISRCILDYPNIETGGDLFGYWTNEGVPVVMYAIGPGRKANHQNTFFVQDVDYFVSIASHVGDKYQLSHMGEWHSHHQLGLARPSGHDANTIFNGIREVPLRRMLLCIANYRDGETTINPYMFHENNMLHYVDASWRVLPLYSPFRDLIDTDLKAILIHPATPKPNHGSSRFISGPIKDNKNNQTVRLSVNHWLRHPDGVAILKGIISLIQTKWPTDTVATQWDETGNIFLSFDSHSIELKEDFPTSGPVLLSKDLTACEIIPWFLEPDDDDSNDVEEILHYFDNWISLAKQTVLQ